MTDELKPVRCGCGGEAKVDWTTINGAYMAGVVCQKCGMKTASVWQRHDKDKAIAEAIQAWNRAMGNRMELQTVKERKKEKWQRRKGSDCWECSECHAVLESDDIVRHNFYYCYHCGADMMNEDGYMKLEGTEHE